MTNCKTLTIRCSNAWFTRILEDLSLHFTTSSHPVLPWYSTMPGHKRRTNGASSGEDFSDVGPSTDTDDDAATYVQDNWTFPVVPSKAGRGDYEAVRQHTLPSLLTD